MSENTSNRELTSEERNLVRWMLEHGEPDASRLLPQMECTKVLPTRCPCGCATIEFVIESVPERKGPLRPVADFVFGGETDLSGIVLYEIAGVLCELEVYGLAGDAPKTLPSSESLRPLPRTAVNA